MPPPGPPPETPGGSPRPNRRWWAIAAAAVVLVGGGIAIAVVAGGGDDDGADVDDSVAVSTTPQATASVPAVTAPEVTIPAVTIPALTAPALTVPVTVPALTAPDVTIPVTVPDLTVPDLTLPPITVPGASTPPDTGGSVIGDAVTLPDGSTARVNAVTPDAPTLNEFFPLDPGLSLTRIEIEACGGSDGFFVNPFYWSAFLDDSTTADPYLFGAGLPVVELAPGGCVAGRVEVAVPDGQTATSLVLTNSLFEEVARWDLTTGTAPAARLEPTVDPASVPIGQTVELPNGATAVATSATPGATPTDEFLTPPTGYQTVAIDVELCAGTESLSVSPFSWLVVATDNEISASSYGGGTLATIELAAGQCAAGIVEAAITEGKVPAFVLYSGLLGQELARWSVG